MKRNQQPQNLLCNQLQRLGSANVIKNINKMLIGAESVINGVPWSLIDQYSGDRKDRQIILNKRLKLLKKWTQLFKKNQRWSQLFKMNQRWSQLPKKNKRWSQLLKKNQSQLQVSIQIIMIGHAVIVHSGTQMEEMNAKCASDWKPIKTNNPHNNSNLLQGNSLFPNNQALLK